MEWIFLKKSRWNVASKLEATRAVKRLYGHLIRVNQRIKSAFAQKNKNTNYRRGNKDQTDEGLYMHTERDGMGNTFTN